LADKTAFNHEEKTPSALRAFRALRGEMNFTRAFHVEQQSVLIGRF
jgi:hypothetical protein